MAIQQIQKSSTFKPDMIGDLVEVTVYDPTTGELGTVAGTLRSYVTNAKVTRAFLDGDNGDDPSLSVRADERLNLSITHYEYILDLTSAEDDQ